MTAIIVIGLGYGDEGKGSIVDSLVRENKCHLVVRFNGGFQAAHNVYTETAHHTFNQFGSGTFAGADTLITAGVVINPLCMQMEANALNMTIDHPLSKIWVSEDCLVTTPFHRALNQIRELSRSVAHGSTGNGIGETVRLAILDSNFKMLKVSSLTNEGKIRWIRDYCHTECMGLIHDYALDGCIVDKVMHIFERSSVIPKILIRYRDWIANVKILDHKQCCNRVNCEKTVVFEGAQGVLLDQRYGFHPYTSWSDTTDSNAHHLINIDAELQTIGVIRTYMTRHGAGPLVTQHNEDVGLAMLDDNKSAQYQGGLRTGYLDLVALKYAVSCCGTLDRIALTHCDKIGPSTNQVCIDYDGSDLLNYCPVEGSAEAFKFTQKLKKTIPKYRTIDPVDLNATYFKDMLEQELKLPVVIQSFGKQHKDKIYGTMPG
jgi:adenylosuccinate synthase